MTVAIGRRELLVVGVAALTAGLLSRSGAPRLNSSVAGIRLFDPTIAGARELAQTGIGSDTRLIALVGDPVRLWRELLVPHPQPVSGFTRWSDFVLFRGLAAEHRMRVRHERDLSAALGSPLFAWEVV